MTSATLLLVAALLLACTNIQLTNARALRHDTLYYDSRLAAADQVALRERYHAIRYRGAVDDDASVATALAHEREALAAADAPFFSKVVRELAAIATRIAQAAAAASATSPSGPLHTQDTTAATKFTAVTSAIVPVTAPLEAPRVASVPVATRRASRRGQLCIARMCGLHLFFASVSVTFAACVVVVYLLDQQLHRQSEEPSNDTSASMHRKKTAAAARTVSPSTKRMAMRTSSGLRARISRYYRDVAELSASVLRPRPPLGL